jgi:hypothetical protein
MGITNMIFLYAGIVFSGQLYLLHTAALGLGQNNASKFIMRVLYGMGIPDMIFSIC